VLLEQFCESRDGDVEGVGAKVLLDTGDVGLLGNASGGLEVSDGGLRLGVDVVLEGAKALGVGVVEESALLEEERKVGLAAGLGGKLG
jgi:hypothetical protein